jgi:hypothetical protein
MEDIKPPVMIAIIAAVLVLLVGGWFWYDRRQKAALNEGPTLTKQQYMPPPNANPQ